MLLPLTPAHALWPCGVKLVPERIATDMSELHAAAGPESAH
jgi:hypothetical protein